MTKRVLWKSKVLYARLCGRIITIIFSSDIFLVHCLSETKNSFCYPRVLRITFIRYVHIIERREKKIPLLFCFPTIKVNILYQSIPWVCNNPTSLSLSLSPPQLRYRALWKRSNLVAFDAWKCELTGWGSHIATIKLPVRRNCLGLSHMEPPTPFSFGIWQLLFHYFLWKKKKKKRC